MNSLTDYDVEMEYNPENFLPQYLLDNQAE